MVPNRGTHKIYQIFAWKTKCSRAIHYNISSLISGSLAIVKNIFSMMNVMRRLGEHSSTKYTIRNSETLKILSVLK